MLIFVFNKNYNLIQSNHKKKTTKINMKNTDSIPSS